MEYLRKAHKKADIVSNSLIVSMVILVISAVVVGFMGKWLFLAFFAALAITLGTLCDEVCLYEDWLKYLIHEIDHPHIRATFSWGRSLEITVMRFPFARFAVLCEIDQKDAWTRDDEVCYYECARASGKTDILRVYAWFSFLDYIKFRRFLKKLDAKKEREKQETQRAHEIELYKDFIQALEKDVKAYAENGPFKKE